MISLLPGIVPYFADCFSLPCPGLRASSARSPPWAKPQLPPRMPHAASYVLRAACSVLLATCFMFRAACCMLHAGYRILHTACRRARYGVILESNTFAGRTSDFLYMVLMGMGVMLVRKNETRVHTGNKQTGQRL